MAINNSGGCNEDFCKCEAKYSNLKKIVLECGNGTGERTFTSSDEGDFQLANISIDVKSLGKSNVLIKFSSLVKADLLENSVVRLKYELFRLCDGRQALPIGTWMYEKQNSMLFSESIQESFGFIFCECKTLNDCCDYFVTVTPIEIIGDGVTVTVSNGRIAAFSQALYDNSMKQEEKDLKKHEELELQEIISTCGKGSSTSQGIIQGISSLRPPITIAQVTVDTSCLNIPKILLEFSSVIGRYNLTFDNLVLQFELFRLCGDGKPVSCGTWTFEESTNIQPIGLLTQEQRSFNFIFCECQNISDCCIYFVTVTALQATSTENGLATWQVCNTEINAYAQSTKNEDYIYRLENKRESTANNTLHPKPKKAILECGTGNGSITLGSSSEEVSFQLAQVSIDTSNLCKPVVNIEFSSTVRFETDENSSALLAELQYELFRVCEGGAPVAIKTWSVDKVSVINNVSAETVSFTYCDCITCPGCCDYFVTVTLAELSSNDLISRGTITFADGRVAALAQEG